MTTRSFETIDYEVRDGVARIRFDRPDVLNAFSSQMYGDVKNALRLANHSPDIDIIVITGSGRAFATGGDLRELLERLDNPDPLAIYRFDDNLPFDVLRHSAKTTIAAVNGICVAGGLMVTLMCDISIAARSAVFGAPEGRVGLADAFLPNMLYARIPMPQLKYLLYTGKNISADQALQLGLITQAVDDDDLDNAVDEMVRELRQTAPLSRRLYKTYLDRLIPQAHIDDSHPAMRSPEAIERLKKFAVRNEKKTARLDDGR